MIGNHSPNKTIDPYQSGKGVVNDAQRGKKKVTGAALKGVTAVGVALGGASVLAETNVVYAAEMEQPASGELVHDIVAEQTSMVVQVESEQTSTSEAPGTCST